MTVNDFNAQAQSNFIKAVASSTGASTSSVQITGITVLSTRRRLLSPSILVHFSILAKDAQAAASIKNSFSVESLNKELIKNGLPQASLDLAKSSAGASNNTYLYLGIGGGIFLFAIVGLGLWRRLRKNRVKTVVREPRPEVFGTGILVMPKDGKLPSPSAPPLAAMTLNRDYESQEGEEYFANHFQ